MNREVEGGICRVVSVEGVGSFIWGGLIKCLLVGCVLMIKWIDDLFFFILNNLFIILGWWVKLIIFFWYKWCSNKIYLLWE